MNNKTKNTVKKRAEHVAVIDDTAHVSQHERKSFLLGCLIAGGVATAVSVTASNYLATKRVTELSQNIYADINKELILYRSQIKQLSDQFNQFSGLKTDLINLEEVVLTEPKVNSELEETLSTMRTELQLLTTRINTQKKEYDSTIKKLQNEFSNKSTKKPDNSKNSIPTPKKTDNANLFPKVAENSKPTVTAKDLLLNKNNSATQNETNFIYQLISIEYRSGKLWAVIAPKNYKNINQLRFLSEGDNLSEWRLTKIDRDKKLATFKSGQREVTLKIKN